MRVNNEKIKKSLIYILAFILPIIIIASVFETSTAGFPCDRNRSFKLPSAGLANAAAPPANICPERIINSITARAVKPTQAIGRYLKPDII